MKSKHSTEIYANNKKYYVSSLLGSLYLTKLVKHTFRILALIEFSEHKEKKHCNEWKNKFLNLHRNENM